MSRKITWTVEVANQPPEVWSALIVEFIRETRKTKPAAQSGETRTQRASVRGSEGNLESLAGTSGSPILPFDCNTARPARQTTEVAR